MPITEHCVTVGDRGRIVLPASIRAELHLNAGSHMLLQTEPDGSLHLRPYETIAKKNLGMFAHLAPKNVSMVDELIKERREEAAREAAEIDG